MKPTSLKDHVLIGLSVGVLTPLLLGIGVWYLMQHVAALRGADLLLIGCVAANIIWVKYFNNTYKENATKGVVSATFLWAFAFFIYKISQEL